MMLNFLVDWLSNVPAMSLPYALAVVGLIISERSGVLFLGAEGLMLIGALSAVGSAMTFAGHPILALGMAMVAASGMSLLFAVFVVILRINQIIAGLAMVFLCQGLTNLAGSVLSWANSPIPGLDIHPFGALSNLPVIGPLIFSHDILIYASLPLFAAISYVLARTNIGLRLRSVGESPEAADAAGVNVILYRVLAIVIGSSLIGLAGAYLSIVTSKIWMANMTSGRGWIAVALVVFAQWKVGRALVGALLFGAIESAIPQIAASGIQVPQYFLMMLPYVATLVVMTWQSYRSGSHGQPAALGRPFVREERT